MFHFRKLKNSFIYAFRGLHLAWQSEQNFRIQALTALAVLAAAFWLGLSTLRITVIVLVSLFILVLELFNTFFEKLIDLLNPRLHHHVGMLKDLLAAAVLVASVGAVIVGALVFWPYL